MMIIIGHLYLQTSVSFLGLSLHPEIFFSWFVPWLLFEFNKVTLYKCTGGQWRGLLIDRSVAHQTIGKVAEAIKERGWRGGADREMVRNWCLSWV